MKIGRAIEDVRDAEVELAEGLRRTAERHAAEHDVYHLGHTLAGQSRDRVRSLRPFAARYGVDDIPDPSPPATAGVIEAVRRKASEMLGRSEASGLLLLADLRESYLIAQRAEISWVILLQAAKAARDAELIEAVTTAHEQAETTAKWLRTKLKAASPQILAT